MIDSSVTLTSVVSKLNAVILSGRDLAGRLSTSLLMPEEVKGLADEYISWENQNLLLLRSLFVDNRFFHQYIESTNGFDKDFSDAREFGLCYEKLPRVINAQVRSIEAIKFIIEPEQCGNMSKSEGNYCSVGANSRKVFVVHGHNEQLREKAARLIENLGMEPIVIVDEPGSTKTVIEKIEGNSDVGFTIVLMTGDDIGYKKGEDDNKKERARQNVVFELGYFIGKLGRGRVACLYDKNIELFSDIYGFYPIEIDSGEAWRFKLAEELKKAGFSIDANKLLK